MKNWKRVICISFLLGTIAYLPLQAGENNQSAVLDAVKQELSKRSLSTGTVDIYDGKLNKVRNLKVAAVKDAVTKIADGYVVSVDTKDKSTGDIVSLNVNVSDKDGTLKVGSMLIDKVTENKAAAKKEFTDAEVQTLMKNYLDTQAKFTGHMMLFDEDNKKMRNLDLVKLDPVVRHLGMLSISRANYKDVDSGEMVGVDVTVENKEGQLNVQSLRIRDIKKP